MEKHHSLESHPPLSRWQDISQGKIDMWHFPYYQEFDRWQKSQTRLEVLRSTQEKILNGQINASLMWKHFSIQFFCANIFFCKNLSGLSALALALHKGHNISMTKEMFVNKKLYNTVMWEDQADFDMALKVM